MTAAPANELGYLVKRVQQALRAAIDPALADLDLTMAQYAALYHLERHPGASNAELARLAFVTPQSMVRVVVGLEQAGLLRRAASSEHAKILRTHLTAKGKRTLDTAQERVDRIHALMFKDLDPAQTDEIGRCLTLMAARLEQAHDAPALLPQGSKARLAMDEVPTWRNGHDDRQTKVTPSGGL